MNACLGLRERIPHSWSHCASLFACPIRQRFRIDVASHRLERKCARLLDSDAEEALDVVNERCRSNR